MARLATAVVCQAVTAVAKEEEEEEEEPPRLTAQQFHRLEQVRRVAAAGVTVVEAEVAAVEAETVRSHTRGEAHSSSPHSYSNSMPLWLSLRPWCAQRTGGIASNHL